jgi:hypothetical protein
LIKVVASNRLRAHACFRGEQRRQRNSAAIAVADLQLAEPIGIIAECSIRLNANLIRSVEFVEVVDVNRSQIGLQRREHVVQMDSHPLGLDAVDVEINLRHAGTKRSGRTSDLRSLAGCIDECLRPLLEDIWPNPFAVFHLHLKPAGHA